MSEPQWTGGYERVTAEIVKATEQRVGVTLPSDYRDVLITTNGGTPKSAEVLVPSRGPAIVSFLYGLRNERTSGDLEYEQATLSDPLPRGFIAIGHDAGGNSLLIATVGKYAGQVLFWARNGLWMRDDGVNAFPIATSFSEFIESLRAFETFSLRKVTAAVCRCVWSKLTDGVFL